MSIESVTTFVICRHGQTDGNVNKVLSGGNSNHQLTATGKAQAAILGEHLKSAHSSFDAYYSSDLDRSKETAKVAFGSYEKEAILALSELQEIRNGQTEGMPATRRAQIWHEYTQNYLESVPSDKRDPFFKWNTTPFEKENAETIRGLYQRVSKTLIDLAKLHPGKKVGIVAHGALIHILIMYAELKNAHLQPGNDGLYQHFFERKDIPNCAVATFKCTPYAPEATLEFVQLEDPVNH